MTRAGDGRRGEGEKMPGYAVVDVETTGLFPGAHDRIVEIGVVQVSPFGEVESTWTTLVNPERDLGPQRIHGISAADVLSAPTFDRVAGTLATLLAGRAFVAHNASFDMRFVRQAFGALGYDVPVVPETSVCTMRWASQLMPNAPRTLAGCCECAGITLENAHAALADATATAALLRHYLALMGMPTRGSAADGCSASWAPPWSGATELAATALWPSIPVHDVACVHRGHASVCDTPFLSRMVEHLPRTCGPAEEQEYLALLDRALLDRFLSVREREALVCAAEELGIDRVSAVRLHRDYLRALARAAHADGVVTPAECKDLGTVAGLLCLTTDDVAEALHAEAPVAQCREAAAPEPEPASGRFCLRPGDLVVFTGEMLLPRDEWVARAAAAGLIAHQSVTKTVALVVAADPDSLSGKARKAAGYGIPIVTEAAFAGLIEVMSVGGALRG